MIGVASFLIGTAFDKLRQRVSGVTVSLQRMFKNATLLEPRSVSKGAFSSVAEIPKQVRHDTSIIGYPSRESHSELNLDNGVIITFNQEDSFDVKGKPVKAIPAWKYLSAL